ncbi:MAG: hypothetical protein WA208_11555 [Thermoanaerobaculia bacterium]
MKLRGSDRPRTITAIVLVLAWGYGLLRFTKALDWVFVSYIFYEMGGLLFERVFATLGVLIGTVQWYAGWRRGFVFASLVIVLVVAWAWSESFIYGHPLDFGEGPTVCYKPYGFDRPFREAECKQALIREGMTTP